jgi:hypothetical protein
MTTFQKWDIMFSGKLFCNGFIAHLVNSIGSEAPFPAATAGRLW